MRGGGGGLGGSIGGGGPMGFGGGGFEQPRFPPCIQRCYMYLKYYNYTW